MTGNQGVEGSNPSRSTNQIKHLALHNSNQTFICDVVFRCNRLKKRVNSALATELLHKAENAIPGTNRQGPPNGQVAYRTKISSLTTFWLGLDNANLHPWQNAPRASNSGYLYAIESPYNRDGVPSCRKESAFPHASSGT